MRNLALKHVDQKSKGKLQKKKHTEKKHPTYRFKYLCYIQSAKLKRLHCSAEIINTYYFNQNNLITAMEFMFHNLWGYNSQ